MTAAKTLGDQVGSCGGVGMAGLAARHLGALASPRPVAAICSFSPDRVDQLPGDGVGEILILLIDRDLAAHLTGRAATGKRGAWHHRTTDVCRIARGGVRNPV